MGGRRASIAAGPYVLLVPAAIALAAVSIYPLVYGFIASVRQFRYGLDLGFAGLNNYINVVQDETFTTALATTAKYVVLCVVIETLLGLGLALLVNRELRGASLWRIGIILPMTVAPVVVGVMWRLIYASDIGIADPVMGLFGIHGVHVLGPTNLPAAAPFHASQMYSKNLANFLALLVKDGELVIDLEDEIVDGTLVTRDGKVVCSRVLEALGEPVPATEAAAT